MPVNDPLIPAKQHADTDGTESSILALTFLGLLMAFASISTDMYLPELPAMAVALHSTAGHLSWSVSTYLVGFTVGQIFWGPISDRIGRRLPIGIGLFFFIVGSGACAFATSAGELITCRIVQAVGASASVVISRAIVRDLYSGSRAARMMSTLMTVMAVAPLLGPFAGSVVAHFAGWRAIFWVLVVVGIATLCGLFAFPETLPAERRAKSSLRIVLKSYRTLFIDRSVLTHAGVAGFGYGASFAYVAGSPFAYISYHHVSPHWYGALFASGIVGMMTLSQLNARWVMHHPLTRLIRIGTFLGAVASIAAAVDARFDLGGLLGLFVPLFLVISSSGLVTANAASGAMHEHRQQAGAVSAIVGAAQYGMGVVGSGLVGLLSDGTPWPLALVVAFMSVLCCVCAMTLRNAHG